jgi:hypothetical protein
VLDEQFSFGSSYYKFMVAQHATAIASRIFGMTAASHSDREEQPSRHTTLSLEQIATQVLGAPGAADLLKGVLSRIKAARTGARNDATPTIRRDKLEATAKLARRLRHHVGDLTANHAMILAEVFGWQSPRFLSDAELENPGSQAVDLPLDERVSASPLAALREIDLLVERLARLEHACGVIAARQTVRRGNPETAYHVEMAVRLLAEVWHRVKREPITRNRKMFQFLVSRALQHCDPPMIPEEAISTALRYHFAGEAGEGAEPSEPER